MSEENLANWNRDLAFMIKGGNLQEVYEYKTVAKSGNSFAKP